MANYGDNGTVTGATFVGKQVETIATALVAPVVDYLDLAKATAHINIEELSGKQEGAFVLAYNSSVDKYYLATATGNLPASPWNVVEFATVNTPV